MPVLNFFSSDTVGIHQGSIIVNREEGGEAMQEIPVVLHVVEDAGLVFRDPMSKMVSKPMSNS